MDRGKQQHRQQHQQHSTRHDTSSGALDHTDYPDLHVVFEFFTDNPQKSMPTDSNSPQKDSPYYDPYWDAIRSMQSNENFLEGILLRCVDCNRKLSLSCLLITAINIAAGLLSPLSSANSSLYVPVVASYVLMSLVISPAYRWSFVWYSLSVHWCASKPFCARAQPKCLTQMLLCTAPMIPARRTVFANYVTVVFRTLIGFLFYLVFCKCYVTVSCCRLFTLVDTSRIRAIFITESDAK